MLPLRVLLVEDKPEDAEIILHALRHAGYDPEWERVDTEQEYLDRLEAGVDIVLSDHAMPQFDGPKALRLLQERGLEIPFISISGTIGEEVAVQVMQHGATDYLLKHNLTRLGPAVASALQQTRLRKERRQLEEQFRQAQKMEAIGRLSSGVAHDFNNILTVIQGYATLLEQGAIDSAEVAREISFAVERAAGLSRQLLTFSRKQVMQPRALDLNTVVTDLSKMLRRTLGKDLMLVVETAPDLPMIYADRGMMEQILLNLALNARDAMPDGGQLAISTSAQVIGNEARETNPDLTPGLAVCLRVSDSGCGISPENLARIYEPFFTTKDINKGTGLGLATVQGIVKEHRGWIQITSEVGHGTTFEILFPAYPGVGRTAPENSPEAPVRGGHEIILLVEDEPALRSMVRRALKHFGYEVREVASGQQALAIFEQSRGKIDLLLTDMTMPDVHGRDLAQQLRAKSPGLRVLYTSGYRVDLVGRGLSDCSFLQKPYTTQALANAVHDCLRR